MGKLIATNLISFRRLLRLHLFQLVLQRLGLVPVVGSGVRRRRRRRFGRQLQPVLSGLGDDPQLVLAGLDGLLEERERGDDGRALAANRFRETVLLVSGKIELEP